MVSVMYFYCSRPYYLSSEPLGFASFLRSKTVVPTILDQRTFVYQAYSSSHAKLQKRSKNN